VLRPPLEPEQYTSIAFTERLAAAGVSASVGTVGDASGRLLRATIALAAGDHRVAVDYLQSLPSGVLTPGWRWYTRYSWPLLPLSAATQGRCHHDRRARIRTVPRDFRHTVLRQRRR
jgi:hypothetical protein